MQTDAVEMTEEDRAQLRQHLAVYLGRKPEEDELKERYKNVHDDRIGAHKRLLQVMTEKRIPICKSREYPYQVSIVNKKRKTAPKATDYLDTVESKWGQAARAEVEQDTKRRCTEVKEAPTLKLSKRDEPVSAPSSAPAPALGETPKPVRYDEDNSADESE